MRLFKMYSADFIKKVKELYKKHKTYLKTAQVLNMKPQTVSYMVKNNYDRVKKKTGPKKRLQVEKQPKSKES